MTALCRLLVLSLLSLVALLPTAAPAADTPFAFKKYALGSSRLDVLSKRPFTDCENITVDSPRGCGGHDPGETIAGKPVDGIYLDYYDDKLYRITLLIAMRDYTDVVKGLAEKYGEPQRHEVETFFHADGTKYKSHVYAWMNGVSIIFAIHNIGDYKTSEIRYVLNGAAEKDAAIKRRGVRESAKDM